MKYVFAMVAAFCLSLACVGIAGYLAINDRPHWGWFLFVALCAFGAALETRKI